jgi:lipopolysaccharide transport system ATP-binding protein
VQDICAELNPSQASKHESKEGNRRSLRKDEFWAVNDVNFELKRGECLGLIGHNGAGKSTLLKMLNGLIKPDSGRITMKGRIGALIELNAGFNPILTGRENVYVYGTILGFSKKEIDQKYRAIVEFAEMGDFMEMPFRSYSSGMKVRLGFAVAAQMEPDVLLIDEVLSVGDIGFRAKCFNAISKLIDNSAVIFVSHNMPEVSRICSCIGVLNNGRKVYGGENIGEGIDKYISFFSPEKTIVSDNKWIKVHSIKLSSDGKMNIDKINYLDNLKIHFDLTIDVSIQLPVLYVNIANQSLQTVAQCSSDYNKFSLSNPGKRFSLNVDLGEMCLNPGIYNLSFGITAGKRGEVIMRQMYFKSFKVVGEFLGYAPMQINGRWSIGQLNC